MRKNKSTAMVAIGALLMVLATIPAAAEGDVVTSGEFSSFAAGTGHPDYSDIEGRATMVRTASGQTLVTVTVGGLVPGETYGSHVHERACDDADAGAHYSFGFPVPGGALDGSEIWPGPFTANPGGRAVGRATVGATAGPDAVSVVIHAPGGAKIACADLS